jgi:hypothetical protein
VKTWSCRPGSACVCVRRNAAGVALMLLLWQALEPSRFSHLALHHDCDLGCTGLFCIWDACGISQLCVGMVCIRHACRIGLPPVRAQHGTGATCTVTLMVSLSLPKTVPFSILLEPLQGRLFGRCNLPAGACCPGIESLMSAVQAHRQCLFAACTRSEGQSKGEAASSYQGSKAVFCFHDDRTAPSHSEKLVDTGSGTVGPSTPHCMVCPPITFTTSICLWPHADNRQSICQ